MKVGKPYQLYRTLTSCLLLQKVSIPRQSRGLYDWAAQSGRWGR